jgi:hypothetical protein
LAFPSLSKRAAPAFVAAAARLKMVQAEPSRPFVSTIIENPGLFALIDLNKKVTWYRVYLQE